MIDGGVEEVEEGRGGKEVPLRPRVRRMHESPSVTKASFEGRIHSAGPSEVSVSTKEVRGS